MNLCHRRFRFNAEVDSSTCNIYTVAFISIRPHRSITYVDAGYCYRPSSLVCLSVTVESHAKTAELIRMPFGMWTRVGPRKHVSDGGEYWRHLANTIEPSVCGGDYVTSCYGGCRQYQWVDERGRRAKCSAAQYMDHVLSTTQSLISDETIFPTKYGL